MHKFYLLFHHFHQLSNISIKDLRQKLTRNAKITKDVMCCCNADKEYRCTCKLGSGF